MNMLTLLFQASLTYAEAQMKIDDPSLADNLTNSLRWLNKLAKILKAKRIQNGQVYSTNLSPAWFDYLKPEGIKIVVENKVQR